MAPAGPTGLGGPRLPGRGAYVRDRRRHRSRGPAAPAPGNPAAHGRRHRPSRPRRRRLPRPARRWAWPIAGCASSASPTASSRSPTRIGSVWCVFNGEFFDYPEVRADLEAKGHRFRTHTDTELIPHLWEDHGEGMLEHLHGQFAFCVYDTRTQQSPSWPATASASARCTGRSAATTGRRSCCSPRRSGRCSPPAWSRPSRTCAASTTCSPSSPCPGRSPASRA